MMEASDLILEKPHYQDILFCIMQNKNYSSIIARTLNKKQSTITEQLKDLEKVNLIEPLKRTKSQKYKINWTLILRVFYDIIKEVLINRKEYFVDRDIEKIDQVGVEIIIPQELIIEFLKNYFSTLSDVGGKRKSFDELVFSFFLALNKLDENKLDEKTLDKIMKKYRIDKNMFLNIADIMCIELYITELITLQNLV